MDVTPRLPLHGQTAVMLEETNMIRNETIMNREETNKAGETEEC